MRLIAILGLVLTLGVLALPRHGTPSERGRAEVSRTRQEERARSTGASVAAVRVGAPRSLGVSLAADRETTPSEPTVDGKNVDWWANRARSNGRTMRLRGQTIARLRSSLRSRVRLGAGGLERAFLCIHRFEGSWTDTGAPYYGGLQMDGNFMAAYGREFLRAFGPASNWTPVMQIATAERAYLSGRGFGPWPNTSRMCGLR